MFWSGFERFLLNGLVFPSLQKHKRPISVSNSAAHFKEKKDIKDYMMLQQGFAGSGVCVATSHAKQAVDVRPSNPLFSMQAVDVRPSKAVEVTPSNPLASSSSLNNLTSLSSPLPASSSSIRKGFFPWVLLGLSPFLPPDNWFSM